MKENFFDSTLNSEVKIFQIDKSNYEFKPLGSNEEIIIHIVDEHRRVVDNFKSIGKSIPSVEKDGITYYSYVYNESLKDLYWKSFLPSSISKDLNFEIQQISFVLFASIKNEIYATIGGGGIRVLKKFMNNRFGLEFFEYLTIPKDDIVISLTVRGISGKLIQQSGIYRNGKTLLDSLIFTEIPTKINLILRDDLKNSAFDFIDFSNEIINIEIGSYFLIKHKFSFETFHLLILKINEILKNSKPNPLSSFFKVQNSSQIEIEYKNILLEQLKVDMFNKFSPARGEKPYKFDIDFIHPSKIQEFYECNLFCLKAKNSKKPFFETNDRSKLYEEGLKYLYDNLEDINNQFEFNAIIQGIRVYGLRDNKIKTIAMFVQHLTCEIKYLEKPVFQIDNNWYNVKNDFINTINDKCTNLIEKNLLRNNIINIPWNENIENEGHYNSEYAGKKDYYVFDKVLGDNIEFCDIMYEDENSIYLIHVKDGFDAKIRDLSNQIQISANRFWNDINSVQTSFLDSTIINYNKKNTIKIELNNFRKKFKGNKEILYVMAFKTNKSNLNLKDKIIKSKSNIAKYSLIQCVQDMSDLYAIRIFDISEITATNIFQTNQNKNPI